MNTQNMTKNIHAELRRLVGRLGPAPLEPRPADEAYDIYSEIRFAKNKRATALAAICYWCGFHPSDALEQEAKWS